MTSSASSGRPRSRPNSGINSPVTPFDRTRSLSLSLLFSSPQTVPSLLDAENLEFAGLQGVGHSSIVDQAASRIVVVKNVRISGFNMLLEALQNLTEIRAVFQSSIDIQNVIGTFVFLFFNLDHSILSVSELNNSTTALALADVGIENSAAYNIRRQLPIFAFYTDLKFIKPTDSLIYDHTSTHESVSLTNYLNQGAVQLSGMPENIEPETVNKLCSNFGKVHKIYRANTATTWIVEFIDVRVAETAVIHLNGLRFGNYILESRIFYEGTRLTNNDNHARSKTPEFPHNKRFPGIESSSPLRKFASTGNLSVQLGKTALYNDGGGSPLRHSISPQSPSYWEHPNTLEDRNYWLPSVQRDFMHSRDQLGPSMTHNILAPELSKLSLGGLITTPNQAEYRNQHEILPKEWLYTQRPEIPNPIHQRNHGMYHSHSSETLGRASSRSNEINILDIATGRDTRTTFMIRNIPNKFTQQMLIDFINESHYGEYDFIYLRIDFVNQCNVGYSFINFARPESVITFANRVVGMKWGMFNSEKVCMLSYANIQGKQALINKFRNSSVMLEDPSWRPKIFHTSGPLRGQEEEFPVQETFVRPRSNVLFSRENAWVPRGVMKTRDDELEPTDSTVNYIPSQLQQFNEQIAPAFRTAFINDNNLQKNLDISPGADEDTLAKGDEGDKSHESCEFEDIGKSEVDLAFRHDSDLTKPRLKQLEQLEDDDVETVVIEGHEFGMVVEKSGV
ncbi:hypothetical protein HK096_002997 [Nowakowskiella sp. JEL0078]|nr:hypothetical protein HK096_002997 [Nowakowskiella sp. JEL0078]